MRTEHVQELKRTMIDTIVEVEKFQWPSDPNELDVRFIAALKAQLEQSVNDFYDCFFAPTDERMQLISRDRDLLRERSFSRASSSIRSNNAIAQRQPRPSLSSATVKRLERKHIEMPGSPKKQQNQGGIKKTADSKTNAAQNQRNGGGSNMQFTRTLRSRQMAPA